MSNLCIDQTIFLGVINGIHTRLRVPSNLFPYTPKVGDMFVDYFTNRYQHSSCENYLITSLWSDTSRIIEARCKWADRHLRREWTLSPDAIPHVEDNVEQMKINLRWQPVPISIVIQSGHNPSGDLHFI